MHIYGRDNVSPAQDPGVLADIRSGKFLPPKPDRAAFRLSPIVCLVRSLTLSLQPRWYPLMWKPASKTSVLRKVLLMSLFRCGRCLQLVILMPLCTFGV